MRVPVFGNVPTFIRSLGGATVGGVLLCVLAWLTHVIVCLKAGLWGFLIAGALVFPIAIIHGIGIWLGIF